MGLTGQCGTTADSSYYSQNKHAMGFSVFNIYLEATVFKKTILFEHDFFKIAMNMNRKNRPRTVSFLYHQILIYLYQFQMYWFLYMYIK